MKVESLNNIMLDIETLGTKPGCVILSVGGVRFGKEIGDTFSATIDLQDSIDRGFKIDASTLRWWLSQSGESKEVFSEAGEPVSVVLQRFSRWCGKRPFIWGNSPSFDCSILFAAYRMVGKDAPWHWYDERCYRTAKRILPFVASYREGVHHNALDDAMTQAKHLVKCFEVLGSLESAAE